MMGKVMPFIQLNFDQEGSVDNWLFPLPSNNIYQNISYLVLPENNQILSLKANDDQVVIFSSSLPSSISFFHQAKLMLYIMVLIVL